MTGLLNQLNKFYCGTLTEVREINYALYVGLHIMEVLNIPSFLCGLKQGEFDPISFYLSVDCVCRVANNVANTLFPDSDTLDSDKNISSTYTRNMAQGLIGTIREQIQYYNKK